MESYDLIMLIVLAGATLFGAWKGLAWQIASLSSIFASYFIAFQFRHALAPLIHASPPWNMFLAMLILYLGSSLAIWLAFRFVSNLIERVQLKEFDRHAGAVLGFIRGMLWCAIITLFAVTLLGEEKKRAIVHSRSGYYIAVLLDRSHAVMPDEVHQVLAPYVHSLDERLGDKPRYAHQLDESAAGDSETALDGGGFPADSRIESPPEARVDPNERAVDDWLRKLEQMRLGRRE
jgi:membrane protein required for colicin V production